MIRLKNLLFEIESEPKKPADDKTAETEKSADPVRQANTNELGGKVLFVGDDETKTQKSYARQVTSAMKLDSNILAFNGMTNAQIAKIIKRVISPKYSIVTIMASGHDGAPGKTNNAIRNLTSAINAAKQYGAKVIVISNPTKSYLEKTDRMYKDHEYPSNDEIGSWVNNQNISDDIIDANSFKKSNFRNDNFRLNDNGQQDIAMQWISIVEPVKAKLTKKSQTEPTTTAPVASVDMDIDVSKGERATPSRIYDFLIDKGLSPEGAAGILGNMYIESGFKTGALGDSGSSLGLVQWHGGRKDRLIQRAKDQGVDPLSIDFQLEHLWWDLTTNFSSLTNTLKTIKDPEDAAYKFADIFENPAVIQSSRKTAARQYYNMFSNNTNNNISVNSKNGNLSKSELAPIGGGLKLVPAAAASYLQMKDDYESENPGKTFSPTDAYRSYSVQNAKFDWDLYRSTGKKKKIDTNGKIALAYPGTSNHGWGKAIDLFPTHAQDWVRKNGERYGWTWAEGRAAGEPWHFTYIK